MKQRDTLLLQLERTVTKQKRREGKRNKRRKVPPKQSPRWN